MRARADTRGDGRGMELRALYSVAALARAANVSAPMLRRLLRANGVQFVRSGRALLVPLNEIQARIPPLWEALLVMEAGKAGLGTRMLRGANGRKLDG